MSQRYSAAATALGGRSGIASSDDGRLRVELSTPACLGGDDGPGTNPEQLFAAAHAASLLAAIRQVAEARGLKVTSDGNVTATVKLDGEDRQQPRICVTLAADLPCLSEVEAQEIVEAALAICPISRATCGQVNTAVRVD